VISGPISPRISPLQHHLPSFRRERRHPHDGGACFATSLDELHEQRCNDGWRLGPPRSQKAARSTRVEDLKIGNKFRQHIDAAIHLQDKLLLLLSEHSIASTWVENEVEAALEKEDREPRGVLFPVRLDDAVMQTSSAWATTLRRTRHIGDFTNWTDPQAYQIAFERLLRDLKQDGVS
jgi:hypothetical protein